MVCWIVIAVHCVSYALPSKLLGQGVSHVFLYSLFQARDLSPRAYLHHPDFDSGLLSFPLLVMVAQLYKVLMR